jgi:hypothetical protein
VTKLQQCRYDTALPLYRGGGNSGVRAVVFMKKIMNQLLFLWHNTRDLTNSPAFSQNKRFGEMLRGILPMWDGAQTGKSDASDDAVS